MTPRSYTQRRRADSAASTRGRILDSAIAVYRDRGPAAATLQEIAQRADVSRGTILHHFGDAEGLLAAVLQSALDSLDIPDERIFDGLSDPEARIRTFVAAMYRFYDRSSDWWTVFAGDRGELPKLPAFAEQERAFWQAIARLQAAALGAAADDRVVAATAGVLLHPWTMETLRSSGLGLDQEIGVMGDLMVDLVRRYSMADD